jgi:hypothetical protein
VKDSYNDPIGFSVKQMIEDGIAQIHTDPNRPFLEVFGSVALQVALAQYSEWDRGMILGLETPRKDFLYVRQADSSVALWMTSVEFKREVASVIQQYDPSNEAVVVMVVPPKVELFIARPNGVMDMVEISNVVLTPMKMPTGVSFRKEQEGSTFYYVFTHKELGKLGRIVIKQQSPGQTEIKCEIVNNGGFSSNPYSAPPSYHPTVTRSLVLK